jgi:3-oxoacyl-[acyl-carrier-protein] synthase II
MKQALASASVSTRDVSYINAHGTGTLQNDLIETRAIKRLFKKQAYKIPISSTKSMIGHLMGAAGAVEAIASVMAIKHSFIPPTINYKTPDPECNLNYVPNKAINRDLNYVLSNSFGFGGSNAALLFKKYET